MRQLVSAVLFETRYRGRALVYQGMRITGAADPRASLENTLAGKLPQRVITRNAAKGFSSYGNQIGLSTGFVREYYHEGFLAKRMEVGAVVGAVPKEQVRRESPVSDLHDGHACFCGNCDD